MKVIYKDKKYKIIQVICATWYILRSLDTEDVTLEGIPIEDCELIN